MPTEGNTNCKPSKTSGSCDGGATPQSPGMVRLKTLARLHVWWPTIDSDIEQLVRNCKVTQAKIPLTLDNPWFWPNRPWQRASTR